MNNNGRLSGKTLFITGASRGIGLAIALKAAKDGANVVVAAKTTHSHPKLPGTIYTAVKEIEEAGGKAIPCVVDIRNEEQVKEAVRKTVETFDGIDILVNNASAITAGLVKDTDMKRYDLMHKINVRGTFLVTKECLPYLKKSASAHILNMSPPIRLQPGWFHQQIPYVMSKYMMSMLVFGMQEEFRPLGIGVNALWPKTLIHTAATEMIFGKDKMRYFRKADIVADAAYAILTSDPKRVTGNFYIDEEVLMDHGVIDFDQYCVDGGSKRWLYKDFFIDDQPEENLIWSDPRNRQKISNKL